MKINNCLREVFDLPCYDSRKSFYGKAKVEERKDFCILFSYGVPVCKYDKKNRLFTRFWGGYSVTTMRHVNSFLRLYDLPGGGKKWWSSLEVNKEVLI